MDSLESQYISTINSHKGQPPTPEAVNELSALWERMSASQQRHVEFLLQHVVSIDE